jgi:hypothetical protein
MLKFLGIMLICFPLSSYLSAQGNLMVSSVPLRAEVFISGIKQDQTTPAIFRNLKAGIYDITVRKTGFEDFRTQVQIIDGRTSILEKAFQPEILRMSFPDVGVLSVGNEEVDYKGSILTVPSADYEMEKIGEHLYLYPMYPGQDTIETLNICLPATSGLAALFWIADLSNTKNSRIVDLNDNNVDKWPFTANPGTMIFTGTAIGLGIWQLWLSMDREKYYKDFDIKSKLLGTTSGQDWEYFKQAQDLTAQNKRIEAIKFYELIINGYPESGYTPESHYRLSRLYRLEGNDSKAMYHLKKIIEEYPVPALFDRSCKGLADLLTDSPSKIKYLQLMVFVDTLYSRSGIEAEIKALEGPADAGQ